ncbi:jg2237 [Pararge aegeria aegeria]|uniref:Jg2237 protein n=1 Tax=Pararge aegeria aegeria TaxID=348720 RepID=A0A8S4SQS0_9NEOP|nr:jg2237 [Pararge aegeria aegeria]
MYEVHAAGQEPPATLRAAERLNEQRSVAILEELGITQRLSSIVQARILSFFGHVSRRDNDSIERLVVQGRIEGTRSRGRLRDLVQRLQWLSPYMSVLRQAAAREEWRRIVKRATTPK